MIILNISSLIATNAPHYCMLFLIGETECGQMGTLFIYFIEFSWYIKNDS
jgi:hypothetical protein